MDPNSLKVSPEVKQVVLANMRVAKSIAEDLELPIKLNTLERILAQLYQMDGYINGSGGAGNCGDNCGCSSEGTGRIKVVDD